MYGLKTGITRKTLGGQQIPHDDAYSSMMTTYNPMINNTTNYKKMKYVDPAPLRSVPSAYGPQNYYVNNATGKPGDEILFLEFPGVSGNLGDDMLFPDVSGVPRNPGDDLLLPEFPGVSGNFGDVLLLCGSPGVYMPSNVIDAHGQVVVDPLINPQQLNTSQGRNQKSILISLTSLKFQGEEMIINHIWNRNYLIINYLTELSNSYLIHSRHKD
ncbi:hypothetical protein K2173_019959 [Erythroxylum novogranatense]|uniref:Uncharacterized protein n=1 Tax=Erythroxylum novogranatense TaxID=1862640 RepID=A0AAV8U6Q1_9ROSI|nr:hypothetical protein K2173_019959 [Erythroxylum novogranatense]